MGCCIVSIVYLTLKKLVRNINFLHLFVFELTWHHIQRCMNGVVLTAKNAVHPSYSFTVVNQLTNSNVSKLIRINFPSATVTRQVISTFSADDPLFTICRYEWGNIGDAIVPELPLSSLPWTKEEVIYCVSKILDKKMQTS